MSESANWPAPEIANGDPTKYAGFFMRVLAHICDGLNSLILVLPLSIIGGLISEDGVAGAAVTGVISLAGMALQSHWIGTRGGSPLRVKVGALVVDEETGAYIGMSRAFVRTFAATAFALPVAINPGFIVIALLDILWMLRDPQRQTLHDKIARTVVQQS